LSSQKITRRIFLFNFLKRLYRETLFCWRVVSFFSGISSFAFGNECLGCHRLGRPLDPWLCPDCKKELLKLAEDPRHPAFDILCLYPMTPLLKSLVHAIKYGNMPGLANYLVRISLQSGDSLETLKSWGKNLHFVPVPLHKARFRERGYNQAEKIAASISECVGGSVENALVRRTFRISQTQLSRDARAHNVAGAFVLKKNLRWSSDCIPVIVDDVFTTGATSTACLYALERKNLGGMAKVCTLLCEESASAKADFVADSSLGWDA